MRLRLAMITLALGNATACQTHDTDQQDMVMASTARSGAMVTPFAYAEANCGGCHAVERPWLSPNPLSPTFADIANQRGLTRESLANWLKNAHNYPEQMDFDLDAEHAEALASYLVTLQDPAYVKPPS